MAISVATINVNGIRAAYRKGMAEWLAENPVDVVLLQEVRAPVEDAEALIGDDYETVVVPCRIKGRAGVAVAVRRESGKITKTITQICEGESDVDSGRWVEVTADFSGQEVTFVSAYLHSGEVDTIKQEQKMAHLELVTKRLEELRKTGAKVLVAGDFNIVHTEADIKNWKPNHNKRAGVLDEEIAYLDRWFESGWVDVARSLSPETQGPYTWWSWRGEAFDNDAGWRIDYQIATPALAGTAATSVVHRAEAYDQRFSDHAPLVVTYNL